MIKKSLLATTIFLSSAFSFFPSTIQASTVKIHQSTEKTIVTDITEVNNLRQQMNIPTQSNGVIEIDRQFPIVQETNINSLALSSLVRKRTYETCGSSPVTRNTGTGTIKATVSQEFTTSISGGIGVSLSSVNASLGTNITASRKISTSTSYTAPKGKLGILEGYLNNQNIDFDQYIGGIKVGTGTVTYPIGICWNKYYV